VLTNLGEPLKDERIHKRIAHHSTL
jgi:hypothetical protein